MTLPNASISQAVLIGVSKYKALPGLPAVRNGLQDLGNCLQDERLWGPPRGGCTVVDNPMLASTALEAVHLAAQNATGTLVVYYAGHGLIDPEDGRLTLALPDTRPERPETQIPYEWLRREIRGSRAPRRVVILDCCYSGRAHGEMGSSLTSLADRAEIDGACLLASAPPNSPAFARPGERYTEFTGALLQVLTDGIYEGPEILDLDTIYHELLRILGSRSAPAPQMRAYNLASSIAIAQNRWQQSDEPGNTPIASMKNARHPISDLALAVNLTGRITRFAMISTATLGLVAAGTQWVIDDFAGSKAHPNSGVVASASLFDIHFIGHHDPVRSAALGSLNGIPIAVTGADDGTVRLWDLAKREQLGEPLYGRTDGIESVLALALGEVDGTPIAVTGADDGTVRLWDLAKREQLGEPLYGHIGRVLALALGEVDGTPIAVTGADDGTVRLWDLIKRQQVGEPLVGRTGPVSSITLGTLNGIPIAVTGADDGTVRLWDLIKREQLGEPLYGHINGVTSVALGELGGTQIIVSGGRDKLMRIWDLATRSQLGDPIIGHSDTINSIAFTTLRDNPVAVTGGQDGAIRVWDLTGRRQLVEPLDGHIGGVMLVALGELDGAQIIVSGGRDSLVRVRPLETR
ncbi:caspase family protein [Polymorphospora sp. NPDC051019]|uniref:caspase, EACC1-associated type n=1 Tax=Polymorphospora sp. NPDC051019 TaxID=3155725 RepID=UPI00341E82CF